MTTPRNLSKLARGTNTSGVLALDKGGTGAATATDAKTALNLHTVATTGSYTDLLNKPTLGDVLPSQTSNSGKFLTTDGTTPSWAVNPLGTVTSVSGTGTVNGLTLGGTVTTSGSLTLGGTLSNVSLTSQVTGTLPTANGGTNLTSFTSGGVVYASSASALATGSALTFNGTNLGVGTASPSGKFQVQATNSGIYFDVTNAYTPKIIASGALSDLQLEAVGNGGTLINKIASGTSSFIWNQGAGELMKLNSTGLGIGTSSPGAKLDVAGSTYIRSDSSSAVFSSPGDLAIKRASSDPYISFHQNDGTRIGYLQMQANGICGLQVTANQPLVFYTNATERARIDSSGNLLVGTTSNANSDKLVVNGQVYQFQTANGSSASPVTNGGYLFGPNSATIYAGMRFVNQILSNNNTAIAFYTTSNAGSATERFRISGDGALGIGSTPSYGTAGQVLTSGGSGAAPTWTTVSGGGGGTPAGSNTQVQFNNSGAFGASANFTFNGTGISTGNVNVTSSTAPTAGMYYNSTATSGLSFYNTGVLGGSSIIQSYYGKSTIPATTNGVTNNETQWLAFGNNLTPAITVGSTASLYTMQGHSYLITDVPSVLRINAGSRGDNTTYNCPADNGVIFVDVGASYGGNASNGRCGVFVNHPRQGLGDNQSTGFKAKNDGFGSGSKSFWALLQTSDPNGGGQPFGFYAQTDTSATAYDNSAPVGLVIDNATVDNYTKTNGGAQMAIWIDRRSGSTARTAIQFSRNSQGNVVGTIQTTNSATSYNTSSDYRLKENIAPLTGAIEKVLRLKPSIYTWKVDGAVGEGFIAHELQEVIPQAVSGTKDAEKLQQVEVEHAVPEVKDADGNIISYGKPPVYEEQMKPVYQGVDTSFLVATLTAAIQEQQVLINQLKTRLDAANL